MRGKPSVRARSAKRTFTTKLTKITKAAESGRRLQVKRDPLVFFVSLVVKFYFSGTSQLGRVWGLRFAQT
jgi:hypothetical protein